ncbi:hypothetical protein ACFZB6_26655 [Streptomyces syringium]|uniref:hypothetical protein n=1 Tax=Streptomyces syringium TaxID=76729 RepID=UPI0036E598D7
MGMWIGRPGSLREITDGAASFDRSPDLAVVEFRSLAGGVTTWAPPVRPRRLKLAWDAMQRDDVMHLDRLARRLDAPGPVAVLDPLTRNLFTGSQAAGRGADGWAWVPGEIVLHAGQAGPYVPNSVSVEKLGTSGGTELYWSHGYGPMWAGHPVTPNLVVTWWVPGLHAAGAALDALKIHWHNAANEYLSVTTQTDVSRPVVATAPAGAAYCTPSVRFKATGMWLMGESVLALGDVAAELLSGQRPSGEGCPAYSITKYSHAPSDGDGAFRDIGLELVEVTA